MCPGSCPLHFAPEHAGKMNFYLAAVDDLPRHPDDKEAYAGRPSPD
jgi:hypothetical protein